MLKLFRNKKAQSTAEYAILIAIVVGAVVAMQVYVRRGIQGRVKDVVDHVGQGGDVGGSAFALSQRQYEPYYVSSSANTQQTQTENEVLNTGGSVDRTSDVDTTATRTVTQGW